MHNLLLCLLSLLKKILKKTGDKNSVSTFSLTTPTNFHPVVVGSLNSQPWTQLWAQTFWYSKSFILFIIGLDFLNLKSGLSLFCFIACINSYNIFVIKFNLIGIFSTKSSKIMHCYVCLFLTFVWTTTACKHLLSGIITYTFFLLLNIIAFI